MERYAEELDFPHLASVVRAVSVLIEDPGNDMHKAANACLQLADLVCDLDAVAERVQDATCLVLEDVDQGPRKGTWNPYVIDFLRYMKPMECSVRDLNDKVPYARPAEYLSDDDTDRADLLLAVAAAQALADGIRSVQDAATNTWSGDHSQQLVWAVQRALWLTEAEFRQVHAMTNTIAAVFAERFERRAKRVTALQATQPLEAVKEDPIKAGTSDVLSVETGAEDMDKATQAATTEIMQRIIAANAAKDFTLMLALAEAGVQQYPGAVVVKPDGARVKPFEVSAQLARDGLAAAGSVAARVTAAVVAAAPKTPVAPGVTVIDVTAGVKAAAAVVETYGAGPAYGDLPAHGTLTFRHTAARGTYLEGNVPGDGHRQVFGSRGQRWSLTRDKKTSYLGGSRGKTADVERIRNAAEAGRKGGWNVVAGPDTIDDTDAKPLTISPARRQRHTETRYAAMRQTRVEPTADVDEADDEAYKPVSAVPGISPGIVALVAEGHFDDDEPLSDAPVSAVPVSAVPVSAAPVLYRDMDNETLMQHVTSGKASAAAEMMRRLTQPAAAPEPVDPFANDTLDELLTKVSDGVPGALDAARERMSQPTTVNAERDRPVTAPPAMLVPVQAPTAANTDIRAEESHLTVWVLAEDVSKATRRGLNQALMNRVSHRSGEKGNRPTTTTTTHKGESKFQVVVTVPAGVDRQHVTNLLTMVATDRSLKLCGFTTPAAETVNA